MARHWHQAGDLDRALDASVRAGATYSRGCTPSPTPTPATPARSSCSSRWPPTSTCRSCARGPPSARSSPATTPAARRDCWGGAARTSPSDPQRAAPAGAARLPPPPVRRRRGRASAPSARPCALVPAGRDQRARRAAPRRAGAARRGWSRLDDAERAGTEALRIARAVGARREEGIALNALGRGRRRCAATSDRAVEHAARGAGDRPRGAGPARTSASAYVNLSHVLGMAGRLDECVELARAGIVELTRFGQQRQCRAACCSTTSASPGEGRPVRRGRRARHRGAEPPPARDHGGTAAAAGRPHRAGQAAT